MLFTLLGVMAWFGDVFFHPHQYLFSGAGDGLRAYYATSYDLLYGDGELFEGVLYPQGVSRVYMDMNPLVTGMMKVIQSFFNVEPYSVGIINLLMILAFFPTAYFVFLLLRKSLIPPIPAVVFALIITFLAPQVRRLTGHFPLSYGFFVPMIWLVLLRIGENCRLWKWAGIYVGLTTLFSFAHPYYFLLGGAFGMSYLLVHFLQHKNKWRKFVGFYIIGLGAAILPGIILKAWEIITTPAGADFVKYPYGFLNYMAGFESVFLPSQPPLFEGLRQFIPIRRLDSEGYAYVGITGFFVLIMVLGRIFILLRKKQGNKIIRPVLPDTLKITLWAGVILLIPAFAYPFQLFPDLLDLVPFIRPFRSLGRLAWIFYYVFMVFSAYYLYAVSRAWRLKGKIVAASVLTVCGIGLWITEAVFLAQNERKIILANPISHFPERQADFHQILSKSGKKANDFQAIIALPFFHIGSEKLQISDWMANRMAFAVSRNTGLPMVNFSAARTPLNHSLEAVNLVSHPLIPKILPRKLPDQRPFLLIYPGGSLSLGEQYMLDNARPLGNFGETQFFELEPGVFDENQDRIFSLLVAQFAEKDSISSASPLYENYFGDDYRFPGEKSLKSTSRFTTLYDGVLSVEGNNTLLEISFWTNLDRESNYLSHINVKQYKGEQMVDWQKIPVVDTRDVMENKARVAVLFTVFEPGNRLLLDTRAENRWFDNILIRPYTTDIKRYFPGDSCRMYNNYLICQPGN
ncbi:MAG: hypothetical protein SF052_09540 [Bacteroidia bacterium]|nr:hypothetical protein [Bacteroidia bacterium]